MRDAIGPKIAHSTIGFQDSPLVKPICEFTEMYLVSFRLGRKEAKLSKVKSHINPFSANGLCSKCKESSHLKKCPGSNYGTEGLSTIVFWAIELRKLIQKSQTTDVAPSVP
jgi:hypothetical protein